MERDKGTHVVARDVRTGKRRAWPRFAEIVPGYMLRRAERDGIEGREGGAWRATILTDGPARLSVEANGPRFVLLWSDEHTAWRPTLIELR
jgi:hypothetical protein